MTQAQVSIYPLGQSDLAPAIEAAWAAFTHHQVQVEAGPMSTLLAGDADVVFAALRDAFAAASAQGRATVMTVTISNACPAIRPNDAGAGQ